MPVIQRTTILPAIGKGPEVRAILEERVKYRQSKGVAAGLSAQLVGPNGPAFVQNVRHDSLAAYDENRKGNQADPDFRAFQSKIIPLLAVPLKTELFETIVPAPRGRPIGYTQRITRYPLPGKQRDLRTAMEERVKAQQAKGVNMGLQTQLFSINGAAFATNNRFADMAALEQYRERNQNDPEGPAYQARLGGLVSASKIELFEVLIPLPT